MPLENLTNIYKTHLEPKLDTICTSCKNGVSSLKNSVGLGEKSTNVFSRGLRTIENAFNTNTCFFKIFVSAGAGLGVYILKEKIPSVPAYLFVGAATGYTIHANISEIKKEIQSKFSKENPVASILSIGITAAASYGTYELLKKFSIVKGAKNAAISASVVVLILEVLKRAGSTPIAQNAIQPATGSRSQAQPRPQPQEQSSSSSPINSVNPVFLTTQSFKNIKQDQ